MAASPRAQSRLRRLAGLVLTGPPQRARKPDGLGGDMKAVRYAGLALVIVVIAVVGFLFLRGRTTSPASSAATSGYTQVLDVQRGNLSASLSVVGQVEALQQASLNFTRLSGTTKLVTLAVGAGNTVTTSQVLATIDPAPYRQALDQAQSDLQAAEASLADLKATVTDLARAQADLALAQANVQFQACLLYTSDAADERSSVDLGGRRIIKKKKTEDCLSVIDEIIRLA